MKLSTPQHTHSKQNRTSFDARGNLIALAAAGIFVLPMPSAWAASINVGVGGCTLVDAITAANTDKAKGHCRAGSGADTVVLPSSSTQTLTAVNNRYGGPNGLPVVTSDITIQGNGSTVLRSAQARPFRILAVSSTGDLSVHKTTIQGGRLLGDRGAGIANFSGTLRLIDSQVAGNTSRESSGGGIYNSNTFRDGVYAISPGTLSLVNSRVSGNTCARRGGGIYNDGTLSLTGSTVSNNTASYYGGGISDRGDRTVLIDSTVSGNVSDSSGGGIYSRTFMSLSNSTVSGNTAAGEGGGIWAPLCGSLSLINSTVSDNRSADGGGIATYVCSVDLRSSTVSGNSSAVKGGGGIRIRSYDTGGRGLSRLRLIDSTVSGNSSAAYGGGIYAFGALDLIDSTVTGNSSASGGGGVWVFTPFLASLSSTIRNSTLSGNTSARGGGLLNFAGALDMSHSTITHNIAAKHRGAGVAALGYGTTTLFASIVAGNDGSDVDFLLDGNRFTSRGDNLIGDGNAGKAFKARGDRTRVDHPGLGPLADNGGPTLTHALRSDSPAVDAVTGTCRRSETDQRGYSRPADGDRNGKARCDIGAFELDGNPSD